MEMGSASSSLLVSGSPDSSDSLQGLKFGKKIYFEDAFIGVNGSSSTGSVTASSAAAAAAAAAAGFVPARKGKSQGAAQPPRCQVEGCMVDLSDAKAYYSRHKVCGMHSKSPKVIVAGVEKRFCQQCSRFHQLPEFDQGKRSCRRKLAGHNERRRKPPAASLLSRNGQLLSSFHGGNNSRPSGSVLDFSYPKILATSGKGAWPATSFGNGGGSRTPCHQWQAGGTGGFDNTSVSLPPDSPGRVFFSSSTEVPPSDGAYIAGASSESSCALSLLSSQPWCATIPARTQAPQFHRPLIPQPSFSNSFPAANSWSFRDHGSNGDAGSGSGSHAARNEMEFIRLQFSGELELALQGSRHGLELDPVRGYMNSHDGIHWSL